MKTRNASVPAVEHAFKRIRRRGHYLAASDGGVFNGERYTPRLGNSVGLGNHFQGMARIGNFVVLSGADKKFGSELYVLEMASRKVTQPFRSNLWSSTFPPAGDTAIKRVEVDKKYAHAGGIAASGEVVAVPLEGVKGSSQVVFYDFSDPAAPKPLAGIIQRDVDKASATALTQLDNDQFVLAVWGYTQKRRYLDFYLSKNGDITKGFDGPGQWTLPSTHDLVEYQSLAFVQETNGPLYLLGFENTSGQAPTQSGIDLAHLWEVSLPPGVPSSGTWPGLSLRQKDWAPFKCADRQANMDAGACAWADASGELQLYSCYHWRQESMIRFSEFREERDASAAPITALSGAWIDLYEDTAFGGHCLSLVGSTRNDLRDYGPLHVEGSHFDDKVSSVRYQIPKGEKYRLFEEVDYGGRFVDLPGTGVVVEISNLAKHTNKPLPKDSVSSSKWM